MNPHANIQISSIPETVYDVDRYWHVSTHETTFQFENSIRDKEREKRRKRIRQAQRATAAAVSSTMAYTACLPATWR